MAVAAPVITSALAVSKSRIDLAWTNGQLYEAIYIERKVSGGAYAQIDIIIGNLTGYQDNTVQDGTAYVYRIRGEYRSEYSSYSNEANATTPLPTPTGPSGYAYSSSGIIFNWNDESQNETAFEVYINGILAATKGANVKTHDASGLAPGTWYGLKVRAKNAVTYSSFTAEIFIFTANPPSAPSNAVATPAGTTTASVTWQDNSTNENGFRVERSEASATAGFALVGTVGAGVTVFEDTGLTSNTQYWYRVYAYNASGNSAYSNVVMATTWAAIAQPTNLAVIAAKVNGSYGAEITFDDNSSGEDSHILERGIDTFSGEIITDGGLENWISDSNLTSWSESGGTSTVNKDAADKHGGSYSCRLDIEAGGTSKYVRQSPTLVMGSRYKLSLWYKTAAGKSAAFSFYPAAATTSRLQLDGTFANTSFVALPTATEWTQISIIFTAPLSGAYMLYWGHWSGISVAAGTSLWFDDFSLMADANYSGDALTDGAMENWDDANHLTSWYEHVPGGSSVNQDGAVKHGGSYSCRLDVNAGEETVMVGQEITLTPGAGQRVSFWYKTEAGKTAIWLIREGARADPGVVSLGDDGLWYTIANSWQVLPTATAWTRVVLEFPAHSGYTTYTIWLGHAQGTSAAASSSIWFDDVVIEQGVFGTTVATLAPNRTYYHDTGATAGNTFRWRVRAKQGASTYSAYSNEVTYTVPAAPAAPADLTVSEYQDEWARITWTEAAGAVGYAIEVSDESASSGFVEYVRVVSGVTSLKVKHLTAGTPYWFRVKAYNGAGDSAYSNVVTATTLAVYSRSDFDRLLLAANPAIDYLIEANPLLVITGWALPSGYTYAYEAAFNEWGVALDAVYENGVALDEQVSIEYVEATSGSWYHDIASGAVYVHPSTDGNPADLHIAGAFWLRFTTGPDMEYNGNRYFSLVAADGIPDVSQEAAPVWEGGVSVDDGEVSLVNAESKRFGGNVFDRIAERYVWINRKIIIRAGRA